MTTETQADFARRLGVSRPYVTQLKQEGRLVLSEDGLVDAEASLARIKATEDPSKARKASQGRPAEKNAPAATVAPAKSEMDGMTGLEKVGGAFKLWQARKMKADAEMAEMEKARMARDLVPRDAAEFAMDDLAAGVRSRLENLPARWAPVLAPMDDLNQIQATLTELVENELRALSSQQAKRAKELAGESA
jgi:transcriptional regulator with XRE-family HTH domain